jgi:general secretion pathway protein F
VLRVTQEDLACVARPDVLMPLYAYRGPRRGGAPSGGVVDAESPRGARQKLRKTGVFPTDLNEERARRAAARSRCRARRARAGRGARRHHAPVQHARRGGLAARRGARRARRAGRAPALSRILSQVRQEVTEGSRSPTRSRRIPRSSRSLYVNMVRAGEASGALHVVLERLADYTENQARLLGKVRSALTYPAIMLLLSATILFFLLSYVVPKVTRIFQETHQQLPLPTRLLLGVSDFVAAWWWLLLLGIAAIAFGVARWAKTPAGRERVDQLTLAVPYFGRLARSSRSRASPARWRPCWRAASVSCRRSTS